MSYPQHLENGDTNPDWLASRFLFSTGPRTSGLTSNHQYDKLPDALKIYKICAHHYVRKRKACTMLDPNPTLNKLATMSENMGAFTAAVNMLGQLVETRTGAGEERCSTTIAQLDAEVAD
jgi:hypothetical protein